MTLTGENLSNRRKTCATLFPTVRTRTGSGLKPRFRAEKPSTKRPALVQHLKIKVAPIIFKYPVRTAQKTLSVSVIKKTTQLMLYREIIAVCSQIHTKHINTLCGQNVELYIKIQSAPRSKHTPSRF